MSAKFKKAQQTEGPYWSHNAGTSDHAEKHRNRSDRLREKRKRKREIKKTEERKSKALQIYSKLQGGKDPTEPPHQSPCSKFENCKYINPCKKPIWICRLIRWKYSDNISMLLIYQSAGMNCKFQLLIDKVLSVGHHSHFKDNKKAHAIQTQHCNLTLCTHSSRPTISCLVLSSELCTWFFN